jgi:NAD(P)-dependent dehydrogenase (short-subunit alcohol dehydrogenase family)
MDIADQGQGGTSGIGAAVVHHLASGGAQIILLTHHEPGDPFLVDYIDDLRTSTSNELIYAEQVDLSSLHSIRTFATKWIDNAPPMRLDMIILCADTLTPRLGVTTNTQDGVEPIWGINYLANFHLLGILSPAIRAQPPDRDVRIIYAACASYVGGKLELLKDNRSPLPQGRKYETSKLASMVFAQAFQKHLDMYQRPDKQPNNARIIVVDPGFTRTPGMRRWLTMGSLWGLLLYLIMWPFWWLVLKSPIQGAQGLLRAAMEAELGRGAGGRFLRECREVNYLRNEIKDEGSQKKLWAFSEKQIKALEKEGAVKRALVKKENEEKETSAEVANDIEGKASVTQPKEAKAPGSRRSRKAG